MGWGWIGQNIAGGQVSVAEVEHAFMTEPVHRAILLDPHAKYLGSSCAEDVGGTYWWTQDFGDILGS